MRKRKENKETEGRARPGGITSFLKKMFPRRVFSVRRPGAPQRAPAAELRSLLDSLRKSFLPEQQSLRWHSPALRQKVKRLATSLEATRELLNRMIPAEASRPAGLGDWQQWFDERLAQLEQLQSSWGRRGAKEFPLSFGAQFNRDLRRLITTLTPLTKEEAPLPDQGGKLNRRAFLKHAGTAALALAAGCALPESDGFYLRLAVTKRADHAHELIERARAWGVELQPYHSQDGSYHLLYKERYADSASAAAGFQELREHTKIPPEQEWAIVHLDRGIVSWQQTLGGWEPTPQKVEAGIYLQLGAFKNARSARELVKNGALLHRIPDEFRPKLPFRALSPRRYDTIEELFQEAPLSQQAAPGRGVIEVLSDGRTRWLSGLADAVLRQERKLLLSASELEQALHRTREKPYAEFVGAAIRRYPLRDGRYVSPILIHAVMQVESQNNPRAESPAHARGLMQLMQATFEKQYLRESRHPRRAWAERHPKQAIFDPELNIDAGTYYLVWLLNQFPVRKALTAYNAGPGRVRRGRPLSRESRAYGPKVLAQTRQLRRTMTE